ncbi:hypothetical protein PBI_PIPEFISH_29 [Mycobacterium phage Pipefish]|uniref:HNH endonuclease n=1 Tax=Mycobacterium phage Pipefish TaxID=373413 RepID=Q19YX6_9CAUD|nr:HNH endonuclease [Mycobacterium phage Pipefish]ABD58526.1 hypothetical protein PBI_PIPEFISH_29 [Mycobacterium phage Pipefish]
MERWKPIDGWPGYEISDHGNVRSIDREVSNGRGTHILKGKLLVPFVTKKGYHSVGLRRDGKYTRFLVHRLVYSHFVGDCTGLQVRHWPDRDPSHNTPDNLTVGTNSDNQRDSVAHGTHRSARKTECIRGHAFTPANTLHYVGKSGPARSCRRCHADRQKARRHR